VDARRIIIVTVVLVAAGWALTRLIAWRGVAHRGFGPPPGYSATWQCRATGFETNMPPDEAARLITAGQARSDAKNPLITLLRCPDCGKLDLEPVTITPEGKVSL
jgi:hypothetical protein